MKSYVIASPFRGVAIRNIPKTDSHVAFGSSE